MTTQAEREEVQSAQLAEEHEEELQEEQRQEVGSLAVPIGLLIMSLICGAGALALVVFGAWPGIILVGASYFLAAYAVRRINRYDVAQRH